LTVFNKHKKSLD